MVGRYILYTSYATYVLFSWRRRVMFFAVHSKKKFLIYTDCRTTGGVDESHRNFSIYTLRDRSTRLVSDTRRMTNGIIINIIYNFMNTAHRGLRTYARRSDLRDTNYLLRFRSRRFSDNFFFFVIIILLYINIIAQSIRSCHSTLLLNIVPYTAGYRRQNGTHAGNPPIVRVANENTYISHYV